MLFNKWLILQESNLQQLYNNTVNAFPSTTKRQHSTDTIKITEIQWTPFLGVKTLFIKGFAESDSGKNYSPIILFKNMSYHEQNDKENLVKIKANDGQDYIFEKINENNDVLCRCNCDDFKWRFKHYNSVDLSLYGKDGRKYEGQGLWEANPLELSGMCKHLIKFVKTINTAGILN